MRLIIPLIALFMLLGTAYAATGTDMKCDTAECRMAEELKQVEIFVKMNVERVIDGDTFVGNGKKIRLWGINAPEKDEPGYLASQLLLQGLIQGSDDLTCKFINEDPYERDVMHCYLGTADLGSMMVQVGMAKDYRKYSGGYYQYEQTNAKEKQLGIWKP
ncbi:MAG TPA: thermonuclease family protein [Micavibrio sp.]|nr:thermonuclease family protein [Micavibrio sp.]HIL29694.1 thermonuclease family protein [Micavibrio sp.]